MQVKGSQVFAEIWDRGEIVAITKYRIVGDAVLAETWRNGVMTDSDYLQPDSIMLAVLLASVADLTERLAKLETEEGAQDL